MRRIRIRRGLDLALEGRPRSAFGEGAPPITRVGILGQDHPSLKARLRVAEGERVAQGQVLYEDRRAPELVVTAPAAGVVTRIQRGERRALRCIEIRCEGDERVSFPRHAAEDLSGLDHREAARMLQPSGLWTGIRERPFGHVPQPETRPHALFVTAMDTRPLAPSVACVLEGARSDFRAGVALLSRLPTGPLFVCTGAEWDLDLGDLPGVECVAFTGPHPAGLAGTHMHFLAPPTLGRRVWHVGYQDAIAIGRTARTGHLSVERVVTLGGPGVADPRHVCTRQGASVSELLAQDRCAGSQRIVCGSVLHGRTPAEGEGFLGRFDEQISVLPEDASRRRGPTTATHGPRRNMVPLGLYERLFPLERPVVPLLRALLSGDAETARALGCLELLEEDLSLLTYACPSKQDYGPHLRAVLRRIEEGA